MPTLPPPTFCLQSLPPTAARFCLDLERFCRDELGLDLHELSLLVAFSGGADSTALLLALRALAPRLGLTLHAATLDHGLRPESDAEAAACARLCASLDIAFHSRRVDVAALAQQRGIGLEEAGREARLAFLEELRAETGCAWIAQGHQLNDLAEDSLMRLIRGSGWPALAGMRALDAEKCIIRPLLLTTRAAVEDFLRTLGLDWTEDPLNQDQAYLRNRVRAQLVPLFQQENPAFLGSVAARWRMARDDEAFFAEAAGGVAIHAGGQGVFLSRDDLARSTRAVRMRVYKTVLASLGPGQALAPQLLALDKAWHKGAGGKVLAFPGRKKALVHKGGILFSMD